MDLEYASAELARLEFDRSYSAGLPADVVRRFRRQVQLLWAVRDENDLRAWKSLRLKDVENGSIAAPLAGEWDLLFTLQGELRPRRRAVIQIIRENSTHRRRS